MKRLPAFLLPLLLAATAQAAGPDILELELRLVHALGSPAPATAPAADAPASSGASLLLDLSRTDGRWDTVWSLDSESRKPQVYTGRVTSAQLTDDRLTLDIALRMATVVPLHVELQRTGETFAGTYTLAAANKTTRGAADGRLKPQRPPLPAGFVPVQPGEHPRILFRKADLPALRQKAKHPLGQALLERMGDQKSADAIGAGIRFQITGDPQFAALARTFAERQMTGKGLPYSQRTAWGREAEQVALAYDLCYDAWPADFRQQVETWLLNTGNTYVDCKVASGGMNWHVCSNWGAKVYCGAGFIGLALWGEKGPKPTKPADPALLPFYEDQLAAYQRLGGADPARQRIFERSRYFMYWHNREAAGTGGFRGENSHYGLKASEMAVEYAACYRRMFGYDLSPYPDITLMVPRLVFSNYFPEPFEPFAQTPATGKRAPAAGRPVPLDINGHSELWGNYLSYAYPIAPEAMKSALLWAWNRQLGVSGPDELAKLIAARGVDEHGTGEASWLFLSYPLDAQPKPPAGLMPLTWAAPDMGFYGFRSGWTGKGDFVLQTYAKAKNIGGWNGPNAGTFHLFGLGQFWNHDTPEREVIPWEANRVVLPDDQTNPGACGRVLFNQADPDGSGSLTFDLSDAYAAPSPGLYSKYGSVRYPEARKDSGIQALRAMAVDYSGKSGSPCLFVLLDRIDGGKSRVWTWNLPDPADIKKVTVTGNSFTLAKADATLRGTFITPVQIEAKINEIATKARKGEVTLKLPSILAKGPDHFFLVATIQPATTKAPDVHIEGTGLSAKLTVGQRRIHFDGTKLILSDN